MLKELLDSLQQFSYVAGLSEVCEAALDGDRSHMFAVFSEKTNDLKFDSMRARKIADEYINLGLSAEWEECKLATYFVGGEELRKYYITVRW